MRQRTAVDWHLVLAFDEILGWTKFVKQRLDGKTKVRDLPRAQVHFFDVEDENGAICDPQDLSKQVNVSLVLSKVLVCPSRSLKINLGEVARTKHRTGWFVLVRLSRWEH